MLEAMKKTGFNKVNFDEKMKLIFPKPNLQLALTDYKLTLSIDYDRPDLVFGYSITIKEKKRNLKLVNRKLSIDDVNEIFEFFKEIAKTGE